MTKTLSRRKAIHSVVGLGALAGLVSARLHHERAPLPGDRVRPPGALDEGAFLDACVRCGLCVQACPYDTLRLADLGDAVPAGTPYFVARENPCRMCEDIPCAVACPTGALRPGLTDIRDADMGLAWLSDRDRCLSYTSAAYCDSCYRACPVMGEAIRMLPGRGPAGRRNFVPTVDAGHCTGCGLCERDCVLDGKPAISVRARHAAA